MKSLLTKLGVAIAVMVTVALNGGCSKTVGGSVVSSRYNVEYKTPNAEGLKVTVNGPAAKLAVILTNPSGQASIKIIEIEEMISNCQTVTLPMDNPQEGQWSLLVKTFNPEAIVFRKTMPFSAGETIIVGAHACLSPLNSIGGFVYIVESLQIVFQKNGDLPISISENDSSLKVNGTNEKIFNSNIADLGNKVILILPLILKVKPNNTISIDARISLKNGGKAKIVQVVGNLSVPLEKSGKQVVRLSMRETVIPESGRVDRKEIEKKENTEAGVSRREAVVLKSSRVSGSDAVKKEVREAIILKRQSHQSGEVSAVQKPLPQEPVKGAKGEVVSSPPVVNLRQLMTHKSDVQ